MAAAVRPTAGTGGGGGGGGGGAYGADAAPVYWRLCPRGAGLAKVAPLPDPSDLDPNGPAPSKRWQQVKSRAAAPLSKTLKQRRMRQVVDDAQEQAKGQGQGQGQHQSATGVGVGIGYGGHGGQGGQGGHGGNAANRNDIDVRSTGGNASNHNDINARNDNNVRNDNDVRNANDVRNDVRNIARSDASAVTGGNSNTNTYSSEYKYINPATPGTINGQVNGSCMQTQGVSIGAYLGSIAFQDGSLNMDCAVWNTAMVLLD